MYDSFACMIVCDQVSVCWPWSLEEGVRSPGAGNAGSCELPEVGN